MLWRGAEIMAADRALSEVFASIPGAMESAMPTVEGLTDTVARLIAPRPGGRRAARRPDRRRHPDGDVRDRQRDEEGAPLRGARGGATCSIVLDGLRAGVGQRAAAALSALRTLGA